MRTAFTQVLQSLLAKLDSIFSDEDYSFDELQKGKELIVAALLNLKQQIETTPFENDQEEIAFFKEIKPEVDGRLIYYTHISKLLSLEPVSGTAAIIQYYAAEQSEIEKYFVSTAEFYTYYRMHATYLDSYYFKRQAQKQFQFVSPYNLYWLHDAQFSAPMSVQLAFIKSYELLSAFISHRLWTLSQQNITGGDASVQTGLITWTGSKASLVELIVALQEHGVFNDTRVPLKKLADYFSKVFNVKIGNIFKIHEDNRLRKKGRKPFIDALGNSYIRRLETDDENSL
ncbi:RteC domain-containing protein [[Flexibacter] sp. ATCC 35208]|uniref:RteC domain-containing protein n=1 Tax=[Flexibacter] sp. ATCC 35208 TaxID=1936242 RepID=UPI0009C571D1|nr:RteC domain-containing protein [[Flexibacter] sp. ATCC 35208]OMP80081.1 hypothetical protein BW716_06200 [[Flexibacter] sp. ATCC 35208]